MAARSQCSRAASYWVRRRVNSGALCRRVARLTRHLKNFKNVGEGTSIDARRTTNGSIAGRVAGIRATTGRWVGLSREGRKATVVFAAASLQVAGLDVDIGRAVRVGGIGADGSMPQA